MENNQWYLSTWFIAVLFAFWFLVIPLIIGIILLFHQRKDDLENNLTIKANVQDKEEELLKRKETLEQKEKSLEKQLIHKQKELGIITLTQQLRIIAMIKAKETELSNLENKTKSTMKEYVQYKEEELLKREETLEQKEKSLEKQLIHKQKELGIITLTQQLRIIVMMKAKETELSNLEDNSTMKEYIQHKEEELLKREEALDQREKKLERLIAQKEKETGIIAFTQQLRIIAMIKAKQQELSNLETSIIDRKQRLKDVFKRKHQDIEKLNSKIQILKQNVINLEDEALYQSFGFYDNKFNLDNSEEYSKYLELVRRKQKKLVKDKIATKSLTTWTLNGSSRKGTAQNNQNIKIAIRSFNHECDSTISKVKFNNVEVAEKKIRTAFFNINKLNRYNTIEITEEYLNLKIEELFLVYEYAQKKQEELEERRRERELLREERMAQKELEEELKKIKKEEQHLLNVISQRSSQVNEQEMLQYKNRLNEIREQIEQVDYRVKNTKAGYVYIISNIGCFGENVYKIGMTRRLEPLDRVRELGGASVPFHFDVHAVIFSEDAPALEASLHRAFHHRRVNRMNQRKEFFKVDLADIKKVVYQSHNKPVEFKMIAEAKEFRETQVLEKKLAKQHII